MTHAMPQERFCANPICKLHSIKVEPSVTALELKKKPSPHTLEIHTQTITRLELVTEKTHCAPPIGAGTYWNPYHHIKICEICYDEVKDYAKSEGGLPNTFTQDCGGASPTYQEVAYHSGVQFGKTTAYNAAKSIGKTSISLVLATEALQNYANELEKMVLNGGTGIPPEQIPKGLFEHLLPIKKLPKYIPKEMPNSKLFPTIADNIAKDKSILAYKTETVVGSEPKDSPFSISFKDKLGKDIHLTVKDVKITGIDWGVGADKTVTSELTFGGPNKKIDDAADCIAGSVGYLSNFHKSKKSKFEEDL